MARPEIADGERVIVGVTVSWNVFADVCAVGEVASVAVIVKVVAASEVVGVPVSSPVAVLKESPLGSVPPDKAKLYGVVPPLAVTGVTADNAVPVEPTTDGADWVVVRGDTVTVNAAFAVVPVSDVGPVAETAPVVRLKVPAPPDGLTVRVMVQLAPAASPPPDSPNVVLVALSVPEQVVALPDPVRPAGSTDEASATPLSAVPPLPLVIVKVRVAVCAVVIDPGLNAAATVGGETYTS